MRPYIFCPFDASELIPKSEEGETYQACTKCRFIHYDNPIPVVATLVPTLHEFWEKAGLSTDGVPNDGIVLVKRKINPFKGEYCLPCGFIKRHSHPKQQAAAEVLEETGLIVRIEQIISACNPMPGEINQITHHYLGRVVGGAIQAGDDAEEVLIANPDTMPKICFRSHENQIRYWYEGKLGSLTGNDLTI